MKKEYDWIIHQNQPVTPSVKHQEKIYLGNTNFAEVRAMFILIFLSKSSC